MSLSIQLMSVGQKAPPWCDAAISEYQKRLQPFATLTLTDLALSPLHKKNVLQAKKEEGEKILSALWKDSYVIALDEKGKSFTSQQLSEQLNRWQIQTQKLSFMIGGPAGMDPSCLDKAHLKWSLSPLTLPHRLVKILLLEQLYRAYSILNNHPYHRT